MKHYKKNKTGPKAKASILSEYKNKSKDSVRIANTPYLVILESPSKCKKIETYLGFQYKCIASNGHIRGLSKIKHSKTTNIKVEPVFDILPEKAAHVEYMREIIRHFLPTPENIFIATDDDREGEAIGWHICETFGLPLDRVRRMIFHEITEKVIQEAARNTTSIRMDIVLAQQARQMLDQLVGFEISPLLTRRLSRGDGMALSAGRCQTPALRFVYDKEFAGGSNERKQEIEYRVIGSFFSQISSTIHFPLEATLMSYLPSEVEVELFLEKSKTFAHEMTVETPSLRKIQPPIPFNTSSLLQYTNHRWNISPKWTMNYCQILYQHGYITYMRTESSKYSDVFLDQIRTYLATSGKGTIREDYQVLLHEAGINPHEAIRVTDIRMSSLDAAFLENQEEKKRLSDLYEAIWKRSIQSCMPAYEYKNVDVFFSAPFEHKYHVSLELPVSEGFMCFSDDMEKLEEIPSDIPSDKNKKKQTRLEKREQIYALYHFLQTAKSPIKCIEIEATFQESNKPRSKYYTESALIQTLEEHGIGRPSTYAMLVDTIQDRGYVKKQNIEGCLLRGYHYQWTLSSDSISRTTQEKRFGQEKNKLVLQPLGKSVIETLLPTFDPIFSYDYTKEMERKLDNSGSEYQHPFEICTEMEIELKKHTISWKKDMQEKYEIDEKYELFFSKKGVFIREREKEEENRPIQRVRKIELDLEKLKRKEYTLEELLEIPRELLGVYQEKEIRLKTGKFGAYIVWGEEKLSWIPKNKELWEITIEDIIRVLQIDTSSESKQIKKETKKENILRVLSETLEIRKGKFGNYLYHHPTPSSASSKEIQENENPKKKGKKESPFYNIKLFPGDWQTCENTELLDWIHKTYGIR